MTGPVASPQDAAAVIDPKSYADWNTALDLFDRLRAETPVVRIESPTGDHDPFWLLTRYDDAMRVSKDNARFLNAPRATVFTNKAGEALAREVTRGRVRKARTSSPRWSSSTRPSTPSCAA